MRSCILKYLLHTRQVLRGNCAKTLTYSQLKLTRRFSSNIDNKHDNENTGVRCKGDNHNLAAAISEKYKLFSDENADVILDVSEEQQRICLEELQAQEEVHDPYANINLSHGVTGVFDIEDLVALLERDKAKNIFVALVPKEYAYVDYIIIVTGKSHKHMSALATFVHKIYKLKKHKTDQVLKIEGKQSKDWIAIDLGNIALHIFSDSTRKHYDLETLWTVGSQYDDKTNELEKLDIMDQYNAFLADFQPADKAQ